MSGDIIRRIRLCKGLGKISLQNIDGDIIRRIRLPKGLGKIDLKAVGEVVVGGGTIEHGLNFVAGKSNTSSATYVDVLNEPATSFTANGKYLLVVTAALTIIDTTNLAFCRVVHGTTPTEFPGSEQIIEQGVASRFHSYLWSTVFTQPPTAEAIAVQFKTGGGDPASLQDVALNWIRLDVDLVENTDWFFSEQNDEGAPPELPTSFGSEFADLTFTPDNNNDDWLILSSYRIGTRNNGRNFDARLNRDDVDLTPVHSYEGEDVTGELVKQFARVFTLSNASHTFEMQALEETAGANHVHQYSNVFALRLNAFQERHFNYIEGQISDEFFQIEVVGLTPFTPTTAGDFFIYGYFSHDIDDLTDTGFTQIRVQINGVTKPTGYGEGTGRDKNWDVTDRLAVGTAYIENLAAVLQDIDVDARYGVVGPGNYEHRFALAFSMELA